MIHIYYSYLSLENHENLLQNELAKFPIAFQEKIKRYRRWQDAQLSLLGRVLLLKGIKEIYHQNYQNNEMKYSKYNKPYFEEDSIQFNISHSGDIVICAIDDKLEIGIDIEKVSNIKIDDFTSQFSVNEWNKILLSNDNREAFFEFWTQKEAVIKSHGNGLAIPLESFEISNNEAIINKEIFYLKEIKIDSQYKCHISSKAGFGEVSIKQIKLISSI